MHDERAVLKFLQKICMQNNITDILTVHYTVQVDICQRVNMSRVNVSRVNMSRFNMSRVNMSRVNMLRVNMSRVNMSARVERSSPICHIKSLN